jgi:hypothetical protein
MRFMGKDLVPYRVGDAKIGKNLQQRVIASGYPPKYSSAGTLLKCG